MDKPQGHLTKEELQALTQDMAKDSEMEARPVEFADLDVPQKPGHQTLSVDFLWDVPMDLEVILGSTDLSVQDVLEIGPGSVIELDRTYGEPVDIYLNGRLVGKGEVVIIGEQFGVKVTEILASFPEGDETSSH